MKAKIWILIQVRDKTLNKYVIIKKKITKQKRHRSLTTVENSTERDLIKT